MPIRNGSFSTWSAFLTVLLCSCLIAVAPMPSSQKMNSPASQLSSQKAVSQPSTQKAMNQPSSQKAVSQPSTQKAMNQPSTQKAVNDKGLDSSIPRPPKVIQKLSATVLTYTGGLKSYFEPCGCQADMLGGFLRLFSLFDGYKREGLSLLSIDTGNLFFEKLRVSKAKKAQNDLKAQMIADLFKQNGYRILGVGPYDLTFGLNKLKQLGKLSGAQLLATNILDLKAKKLIFPATTIIQKGSLRIGFFSLTGTPVVKAGSKVDFPKNFWKDRGLQLLDPSKAAQKAIASLQKLGVDRVVLLSTMGLDALNALVSKVKGIDFAFEGGEGIGLAKPQESDDTLIFSIPKEGKKLGVLALYMKSAKALWSVVQTPGQVKIHISEMRKEILKYDKQAKAMLAQGKLFAPIAGVYIKQAKELKKKIVGLEKSVHSLPKLEKGENGYIHILLALSKKLHDHKATSKRIERYQKEVKIANFKALKQIKRILKTKDGNFYVGAEGCRMCHSEQYNFWKKTRHAKAYSTLVKKNKQFDLDCIGCHVVGWQKPGGLYDIQKPKKLANVQCENCHKRGGLHVASADKKKIHRVTPEKVCRSCHQSGHDPKFNYKKNLKVILGKGHGEAFLKKFLLKHNEAK